MLIHRVLAALVLIPLVIILLFWAPLSLFACVMIAVCGIAAWEWSQFLSLEKVTSKMVFVAVSLIVLALIYFIPQFTDSNNKFYSSILTLSVVWWLVALLLVISYPSTTRYWHHSMFIKVLFAFFTLVPFFVGMLELRSTDYINNPYSGAAMLLYIFVLVWATDSGAYFAGRALGKRKLAPKVSPGKTVEGFMGGVGLAIVISLVVYVTGLFAMTFSVFMMSSILAILASVLGDLTESMFKRDAKIKDSGHLIPGHGGILDRIDSLTAAIPIFAALSLHLL